MGILLCMVCNIVKFLIFVGCEIPCFVIRYISFYRTLCLLFHALPFFVSTYFSRENPRFTVPKRKDLF